MDAEIWKPCTIDTAYKISNHGRIKNIYEMINTIKPHLTGYTRINIRNYGTIGLHRLVALAFIPNNDKTKNVVNHIDGNKQNNHVSNLEWVSIKENNNKKVFKNTYKKTEVTESLVNETWINVEYEGYTYKASNYGRIETPSGNKTFGSKSVDGYCNYKTLNNKFIRVHNIICKAYNGSKPSLSHIVNHKDFNRSNNKPDNLEWVTQKENVRHALSKRTYKAAHNCRKIAQWSSDLNECIEVFNSVSECSQKINITRSGIQHALVNRYNTKIFGGYYWEYITLDL